MKYVFIRDHRGAFPVSLMCRTLEVGRSGLHAWLHRPESPRNQGNRRLLMEFKTIHEQSRKTYGSPRIHAELKDRGTPGGKHRVARLMRRHGIVSRHKRKSKATTNSNHSYPVAGNLLERRLEVREAGQCWVSNITYVPTRKAGCTER